MLCVIITTMVTVTVPVTITITTMVTVIKVCLGAEQYGLHARDSARGDGGRKVHQIYLYYTKIITKSINQALHGTVADIGVQTGF